MFRVMALALAVALPALAAASAGAAHQDEEVVHYAVLVHPDNTVSDQPEAIRGLLTKIFLKEIKQWPGGLEATPFAWPDDTPEATAFRTKVLKMSQSALASHWIQIKQKNGATPPSEIKRASQGPRLLERYKGAFVVLRKQDAQEAIDKANSESQKPPRIIYEYAFDPKKDADG